MRRRDSFTLIIAGVVGLVAFIMLQKATGQTKYRFIQAVDAVRQGHVFQSKDISMSGPLNRADALDLFMQSEDVVGVTAAKDIAKGELIRRKDVRRVTSQTGPIEITALPVPAGMRSLTLASKDVDNVPPSLHIGSNIDIFGNVINEEGRKEMRTLISGAKVLTIEKNDKSDIKSFSAALTPAGTETITKALSFGQVRVTLRPESEQGDGSQDGRSFITDVIKGTDREKKVFNL